MQQVILNNGKSYNGMLVAGVIQTIDRLWSQGMGGVLTCIELKRLAKDPNYKCDEQYLREFRNSALTDLGQNTIQNDVASIVLSIFPEEDEMVMTPQNPLAQRSIPSLFGPRDQGVAHTCAGNIRNKKRWLQRVFIR